MGKWCLETSTFNFDRIFVKFAGQDRHKISDKFDFGPDQTIHFCLSYLPLSDKNFAENDVSTLTGSVLIQSSSNLQVRRTGIKFGCVRFQARSRVFALELLALE